MTPLMPKLIQESVLAAPKYISCITLFFLFSLVAALHAEEGAAYDESQEEVEHDAGERWTNQEKEGEEEGVKNTIPPEDKRTPQQIAVELSQAEQDFEIAQKMFLPWYTGPLITGSSHNVPKGRYNVQAYLFLTCNYGAYSNQRNFISLPNMYVVNPLILFQAGLTTWLDLTIQPQGYFRWQTDRTGRHLFGEGLGDLPIQFGFQILKETPTLPSIRAVISESLPTGQYTNLSGNRGGLDTTGSGVFKTIIGLNLGKILWHIPLHPMSLRFTANYSISNNLASVKGFNAYGGAEDTHGKVKVGGTFNADFGWEISLTQRWVFACDLAYTYSSKSTFSGRKGTTTGGAPALVGAPSSDQLSIAPAIEYNVDSLSGFIGGVWVSLTGRNSASFASFILSYTKLF